MYYLHTHKHKSGLTYTIVIVVILYESITKTCLTHIPLNYLWPIQTKRLNLTTKT